MRYAILTVVMLLSGCSGLHKVGGAEFMQKAQAQSGTMVDSQYIGQSGNRAYVEEWRKGILFGDTTSVLWTPLSELSAADREKLKSLKSGTPIPESMTPAPGKAGPLHL